MMACLRFNTKTLRGTLSEVGANVMVALLWRAQSLLSVGITECVFALCMNSYNQGNLRDALHLFKLSFNNRCVLIIGE